MLVALVGFELMATALFFGINATEGPVIQGVYMKSQLTGTCISAATYVGMSVAPGVVQFGTIGSWPTFSPAERRTCPTFPPV